MMTSAIPQSSKILVWRIYIYDRESGSEQPITMQNGTEDDARTLGNRYIRVWNLKGAFITRIEPEVVET